MGTGEKKWTGGQKTLGKINDKWPWSKSDKTDLLQKNLYILSEEGKTNKQTNKQKHPPWI